MSAAPSLVLVELQTVLPELQIWSVNAAMEQRPSVSIPTASLRALLHDATVAHEIVPTLLHGQVRIEGELLARLVAYDCDVHDLATSEGMTFLVEHVLQLGLAQAEREQDQHTDSLF